MNHILALGPAEFTHAVRRFQAYGNSPGAMERHCRARGERASERVCQRLHALERELGIDLGALCGRFAAREEPHVTAFERSVLETLLEWGRPLPAGPVLLVHVNRVRALNALVERRVLELRAGALRLARAEGRAGPV
jgi:hypothetical protein